MIMIEMITPLETAMQPYLNPFVVWGSARFLVGFCHMHFWVSEKLSVVPGGSSWCCRARRHFAEAVEFRTVQRHHGGADAAGRRRSRIRRSRHRGCLQGSRQVNAVPLPCRESKCFGVKKNKSNSWHPKCFGWWGWEPSVNAVNKIFLQTVSSLFFCLLGYVIYKMSRWGQKSFLDFYFFLRAVFEPLLLFC